MELLCDMGEDNTTPFMEERTQNRPAQIYPPKFSQKHQSMQRQIRLQMALGIDRDTPLPADSTPYRKVK